MRGVLANRESGIWRGLLSTTIYALYGFSTDRSLSSIQMETYLDKWMSGMEEDDSRDERIWTIAFSLPDWKTLLDKAGYTDMKFPPST